jgi:signal peptidase I
MKLMSKMNGSDKIYFCAHVGCSMNPTLCAGDLLEIAPYIDPESVATCHCEALRSNPGEIASSQTPRNDTIHLGLLYRKRMIHAGDVILFRPPEGDDLIVHRVVTVTPRGIRTRGDNNRRLDPWFLQPAEIIGQVVAAWRGQTRRKISGGFSGQLKRALTRQMRVLVRRIASFLRPIYQTLVHAGIMSRLMPSCFKPRMVIFRTHGHNQIRLLLGKQMIGHYDIRFQQWRIRPPFHLFVDRSVLNIEECQIEI